MNIPKKMNIKMNHNKQHQLKILFIQEELVK